jgi:hypothetical protein
MPHTLTLQLQRQEQAPGSHHFRLTLRNDSSDKLLLPTPGLTALRFRGPEMSKDVKWHLESEFRVSPNYWPRFVLAPGESKEFTLHAIVRGAEVVPHYETCCHFEDHWSIELEPGQYDVRFRYRLDDDGFYLDSQYEMSELHKEAKAQGAVVWVGDATSNVVRITCDQ